MPDSTELDIICLVRSDEHDQATLASLDALLHASPDINLETVTRGMSDLTLLAMAVRNLNLEMIAILMWHGADPLQPCPEHDNVCPFYLNFNNLHAQNRDRFHFLATLLNNGIPTDSRYRRRTDHLLGSHINAPLPDLEYDPYTGDDVEVPIPFSHWKTALMYACERGDAYCTRYLLQRRGADVHIKNAEGHDALYFALAGQTNPRNAGQNYTILFNELNRAGAIYQRH